MNGEKGYSMSEDRLEALDCMGLKCQDRKDSVQGIHHVTDVQNSQPQNDRK